MYVCSPEGEVVHAVVAQQVILQVKLPEVGQIVKGSRRNLLQLVALATTSSQQSRVSTMRRWTREQGALVHWFAFDYSLG